MNKNIVIISLTAFVMLGSVLYFSGTLSEDNSALLGAGESNQGSAAGTQLAGTPTATVDFSGNPLVGGDAVAGQFADDGLFSISVIYSAEFGFSPETFTVQQGDVVSFNIRSSQGDVALDIPEYGISLEKMTDQSMDQTVEFTATNKGTFIYTNALSDAQGEIIVE